MKRLLQLHTLLMCLVLAMLSGCTLEPLAGNQVAPTAQIAAATAKPTVQPAASGSGLATVVASTLPPEARTTLALIGTGGPFPFNRDGVIFQNRERILPRKANGYYREYTVITPGEDDRGARRIVVGQQGEIYYTADHYQSFVEVTE